jgi:hypothetical protein
VLDKAVKYEVGTKSEVEEICRYANDDILNFCDEPKYSFKFNNVQTL